MLSKLRSLVVVGTTMIGLLVVACGSDDKTVVQAAPATTCDSSKCATGNTCLPLDNVTMCRKTCSSNDNASTDCPFGYNCTDTQPGSSVPPFCVATTGVSSVDGQPITQKPTGQWGYPCQANLGAANNPACDNPQGFLCYGISPTDGNAYCTQYGCSKDSDCGPGFGCAQINATPNANTAKRSTTDQVQNACIRRAYCSTCTSDVDCPAIAGTAQHCITDSLGHPFCTPECTATSNCPTDAKCATVVLPDSTQQKVCYPRSTMCVGNGDLCSPCRVDTDCGQDGICTHGEYTTEKFCAKKATNGDCSTCPKTITTPARTIGCSTTASDLLPAGYCTGLYSINNQVGADIGCWTPDR